MKKPRHVYQSPWRIQKTGMSKCLSQPVTLNRDFRHLCQNLNCGQNGMSKCLLLSVMGRWSFEFIIGMHQIQFQSNPNLGFDWIWLELDLDWLDLTGIGFGFDWIWSRIDWNWYSPILGSTYRCSSPILLRYLWVIKSYTFGVSLGPQVLYDGGTISPQVLYDGGTISPQVLYDGGTISPQALYFGDARRSSSPILWGYP